MLDITITETRDFVKKLLMDNTFDRFLAMEAFVKSGITYSFDGRVNKDFYDKEGAGAHGFHILRLMGVHKTTCI